MVNQYLDFSPLIDDFETVKVRERPIQLHFE